MGCPQCGHAAALLDTSRPHSVHRISAIIGGSLAGGTIERLGRMPML
jgi:hypothetical protein